MSSSTLLALVVAPALVGSSSLVARRFGSRAGGVVSAFPAIVGPVLLLLALVHGRAFAARAANGTLLGLVALSAFACAYGQVALHRGWRTSLACAWLAAALAAVGIAAVGAGAGFPVGLLAAALSLLLARRLLPAPAASVAPYRAGHGSILARMASAAALVAVLSAAAGAVGALAGGMLAALPILACVLAVFTHHEHGPDSAIALMQGMLAGMVSFVVFCQLIALLIEPYGVAPAFAAATLAALVTQAAALYQPSVHRLLRRWPLSLRPAMAAATGSRGQSS